jgi:hypothetical protein
MKWAGRAVNVGEKRTTYRGNLKETDNMEYRDCEIILIRIFKAWDGGLGCTGLAQDREK